MRYDLHTYSSGNNSNHGKHTKHWSGKYTSDTKQLSVSASQVEKNTTDIQNAFQLRLANIQTLVPLVTIVSIKVILFFSDFFYLFIVAVEGYCCT